MIKVIMADDHVIVRQSIRSVLERTNENVKVVAEVSNGKELLQAAQKHKADIYIVDISMPLLNGIDATLRLMKLQPKAKVIMLSMFDDRLSVEKAIQAGARGCVVKEATINEIVEAIKEVQVKKFNAQTSMSMRVRYFEDNSTIEQARFLSDILNHITVAIKDWHHPIRHIVSCSNLVHNIYDGPDVEIKYRDEILRINHGMKIMKIIRKLMTLFGLDTPYYQEIFDDIRKLQSMANNKADLYGNLCISIHPLDYMTHGYSFSDSELILYSPSGSSSILA